MGDEQPTRAQKPSPAPIALPIMSGFYQRSDAPSSEMAARPSVRAKGATRRRAAAVSFPRVLDRWVRASLALGALFVGGCGGPSEGATKNRTFYDWTVATGDQGSKEFEE